KKKKKKKRSEEKATASNIKHERHQLTRTMAITVCFKYILSTYFKCHGTWLDMSTPGANLKLFLFHTSTRSERSPNLEIKPESRRRKEKLRTKYRKKKVILETSSSAL